MPVVAIVIVGSLSVGIGVNAAVFSWMEAVILRPLPGGPDASGFYAVETRAETGSNPGGALPGVPRSQRPPALVSGAARLPSDAAERRRSRSNAARLRSARLRQLLFHAA